MAQWSKSNTRHRYAPLNTSEPTIRLFQVVRDASSECKGHLKHFHVANAPSYRALSYTWGTNHVMKEICVDGMQFRIRSNLYAFLEHYASRHAGRGEWLWIDQARYMPSRLIYHADKRFRSASIRTVQLSATIKFSSCLRYTVAQRRCSFGSTHQKS